MTPEGLVKRDIKRYLVEIGAWYFMPVANGYTGRGIPDFIACINGRLLAIEAKAEHGQLTSWQEKTLYAIKDAGGIAVCAQAPDHLKIIAEALK